jgi:NF-kappa-B inhibitor-like protein 1
MPSSSSSSEEEDRTQRATRRFLRAARRGDLRKLKRRFRKCPSLDIEARVPSSNRRGGRDAQDEEGEGGRTAMHLACAAGAEDVVKWLIKRGADVTAVDDFGNTPAHLMAPWAPARPSALDRLKRAGADLNLRPSVSVRSDAGNAVATNTHLPSPTELANRAIERSRSLREEAAAARRRRRDADAAEGGYEGLGDASARRERLDARAWREKLLRGAEADAADVLHEPVLFDEEANANGSVGTYRVGSYARFFESFVDDDAELFADQNVRVFFDEEEDAYGTYYRTKKTKENNAASKETERRRAAASATFRAASARDKEAQRVLDEAMRRDAEWRARVARDANETNETNETKSGKRLRENDVKNVSFCSDASSYRRAWGVVAAMADRGELIEHDDLPWPTREGDAASAEDVRRAILGENLADTSPAPTKRKSARAVLRLEMLRWHPDKFDAKMGGFIVEADRERVRLRVNGVARIIAQLFQEAR